jgi:hypothetical protein
MSMRKVTTERLGAFTMRASSTNDNQSPAQTGHRMLESVIETSNRSKRQVDQVRKMGLLVPDPASDHEPETRIIRKYALVCALVTVC